MFSNILSRCPIITGQQLHILFHLILILYAHNKCYYHYSISGFPIQNTTTNFITEITIILLHRKKFYVKVVWNFVSTALNINFVSIFNTRIFVGAKKKFCVKQIIFHFESHTKSQHILLFFVSFSISSKC